MGYEEPPPSMAIPGKPDSKLAPMWARAVNFQDPPAVQRDKPMAKAIPEKSWKPPSQWWVTLGRGEDRMTQKCRSLEQSRETAERLFRHGWNWAWISEAAI